MVTLITEKEVKQLINQEMSIPTTDTIVFSWCSPYDHPVFKDTKTLLVFPAKKVIFWKNEKYFQDKWVFSRIFPNAEEIWISNVPGGFFRFIRGNIQQIVIPESIKDRAKWPPNTIVLDGNKWHTEVKSLFPSDIETDRGDLNANIKLG